MRVVTLVGTEKGAFLCKSDADRREWTIEGPIFKGWRVTASARTPAGRYLLATASQVYGPGLHSSQDLETWKPVERAPTYPEGGDRKLNQIWTLTCTPDRHYAGVDVAGLFTSDDDGASWAPVPGLNDHPTRASWFPGAGGLCAHVVLVDPRRPERIWCGMSAVGVWRTDDGGTTWQPKNQGVRCVIEDEKVPEIGYCVHGLAQDPDNADVIYRQDHAGMYRSRNAGDTWDKIETGLPSWFGFPIGIDRRTRHLFAVPLESDEYRMPVGGRFAVYRSRNGGDSWEPLTRGLPQEPSYTSVLRGALDVDGLDPAGVYIGSSQGDVFVSADGGDDWLRLPCRLPRVLSVRTYVEE
ncbi:MAG TPA: exo-alpha-sialidase [Methylomirabilota bacterium]